MVAKNKTGRPPTGRSLKRAQSTLKARAIIDSRLRSNLWLFEASLEQAALHAVNSLRCLESMKTVILAPCPDIDRAILFLKKAIKATVYAGVADDC